MEPIVIEFKGKKCFDTIEEARRFKEQLGNRYLRTFKCTYPDMVFYIVEFNEE